jgi:hypothetical protein
VNIVTMLLVTLCLSAPQTPVRAPEHLERGTTRQNGMWYLAETGHAVYCYGPVLLVRQPEGGLSRVATFCKGDKTVVPLKD